LLDAEFNRVQVKVKQIIEKADCIAIISDGWSNVCGHGIMNYIISTPQPVFYKSTDTRDNRHTGLYIADELEAVINDLGPQKVFALVTDNAANMNAAWSKVEESCPHITPIDCAAHALNLLLKDTMALKTMDALYKRAKEMVRYVKGYRGVAVIYLNNQSEKSKSTTLKLPSNARRGGVVMFDSLLEGKESLQEMSISQSADLDSPINRILLDDVFWERVVSQPEITETCSSSHCTA
jgi:hypothetical protein